MTKPEEMKKVMDFLDGEKKKAIKEILFF